MLEIMALVMIIIVCAAMGYAIVRGARFGTTSPSASSAAKPRPNADSIIPVDPAPLDGAQIEGNRAATIAIIEYSDFQCPFCGRFATQTFPQFETQYVQSGKVLFAFRQFPLESIHSYALKAAEATECAGDQGRFWTMHTLTFADQQHLDDATLRARAMSVGVNPERFDECLKGDVAQRVRADEQAGKRMLVAGTPTFFLGKIQPDGNVHVIKRMSGAVPFDQFKAAVDSLLATSGAGVQLPK